MKIHFAKSGPVTINRNQEWISVEFQSEDEMLATARGLAVYLEKQVAEGKNLSDEPELVRLARVLDEGGIQSEG